VEQSNGEGLGVATQPLPGAVQPLDAPYVPTGTKWQPERDYSNAGCSHEIKSITLAMTCPHVKTGTPVQPGPDGWRACGPTERPIAYAASHYTGGEGMVAWRAITLETFKKQFRPGDKYSIIELDDYGNVRFHPDFNGCYIALSATQILLDAQLWSKPSDGLTAPLRPAEAQPEAPPPVVGSHKEIPDDDYQRPGG
jgi:hypothetical protein